MRWGIRLALVLTSILFGVLHSNLVGLFVFGLVMALLYLSTRSLLVSMVAHSVSNGIAILVEFVTLQTSTSLPADILTEFRASWWLGTLCFSGVYPLDLALFGSAMAQLPDSTALLCEPGQPRGTAPAPGHRRGAMTSPVIRMPIIGLRWSLPAGSECSPAPLWRETDEFAQAGHPAPGHRFPAWH